MRDSFRRGVFCGVLCSLLECSVCLSMLGLKTIGPCLEEDGKIICFGNAACTESESQGAADAKPAM